VAYYAKQFNITEEALRAMIPAEADLEAQTRARKYGWLDPDNDDDNDTFDPELPLRVLLDELVVKQNENGKPLQQLLRDRHGDWPLPPVLPPQQQPKEEVQILKVIGPPIKKKK